MPPGKRPKRESIGIEGAAQITTPHTAMTSPITAMVFPNGAMAMPLNTPWIVPAGAANRDRGVRAARPACRPRYLSTSGASAGPSVVAPMKCSGVRVRLRALLRFLLFLDHLLGDRRRHFVIMMEAGLERSTPGSERAQVGRVLQNFRHRHQRFDHLRVTLGFHAEHPATARVEVADHVAHAIVGTTHVNRHHWFEQNRPGLFQRILETHRGRYLKGHVRRIDIVIAAFVNRYPQVDQRIAGEEAFREGIAHALFHRRDELARNRAADDLIDEFEALAARQWLDLEPTVAVLSAAARLALVLALGLRAALDGLHVRHLGRL